MKSFTIKAVFFDFDGTLTHPGALDFSIIRNQIGCGKETPIIEFVKALPDEKRRQEALDALHAFEDEGARNSRPADYVDDVLTFLRENGIKVALITRNSHKSVVTSLKNFPNLDLDSFEIVLSRDHSFPPKPDPASLLHAASKLGVIPAEILMVGDYVFDIEAGKAAGTKTVLVDNHIPSLKDRVDADFVVDDLSGIIDIVRSRLPR